MAKYEDLCKEWQDYILALSLEQRKAKFCKYLEDVGVYEVHAATEFDRQDLQSMLIEGVTSLLHEKAQRAKNGTGKGIAHHRELSLAMNNKPDAANLVQSYFWKQMSKHPTMREEADIPNSFGWQWLFNVPELVAGKALHSENDIPALPPAPPTSNEKALDYSPDIDHHQTERIQDPSPDPFELDHDHNDDGNTSNNNNIIESEQHCSPNLNALDIQPPGTNNVDQDAVENEASFTPYDVATHDDYAVGHQMSDTAIISPSALGQMRNSQYLDSWATTETLGATSMTTNVTTSKLVAPSMDSMTSTVPPPHSHSDEAMQFEAPSMSPNHNKTGSTIKGGWWEHNKREHHNKMEHDHWGSIVASFAEAKEERNAMIQILEGIQSTNMSNGNGHGVGITAQSESEERSWNDAVRSMESKLKQYHSKMMQEVTRMERTWSERMSQISSDQEVKARRKSLIWNDDDDANDRSQHDEKAKVEAMQRQIDGLRNELKTKDAVIQSQKAVIEELRAKQSANHSVAMLKNQVLQQIQSQFDALTAMQNQRASTVDDKMEETVRTLNAVDKLQREMKQQNESVIESIESIHFNTEQHHKLNIQKMADYHNAIWPKLERLNESEKNEESKHSEMQKLSTLTSQLAENMNTAAMLSVLRNEYENIRNEKESMRAEMERYRRENDALSLRKQRLEEEAITNREAKRRTIKNLVDELNEMREHILSLTARHQKGTR